MINEHKMLLAAAVCIMVTACGGGSGGGITTSPPPPPPPPPPPVPVSATPLLISSENGEAVLNLGAGIPESLFGIVVFAANHVTALANTRDLSTQVYCDLGGLSTATNIDEDSSSTITSGDTINVSVPSGCSEQLFADPASGNFEVSLIDVYLGLSGDAHFDGTVVLTSDFQIDSTNADNEPITITVVGSIDFSISMRGRFIQAVRLSLDTGGAIVIIVGTNLDEPTIEKVTNFNFLRRTFTRPGPTVSYRTTFDFAVESESLEGGVSCATTLGLTGIMAGFDFETPKVGRYECRGASDTGVALLSNRTDVNEPVNIEIDIEGDGTFDPLTTMVDVFWSDFIDGQLFSEDIDDFKLVNADDAYETVPFQKITADVNDIIYNSVNNRVYISNLTGIVELNPTTLDVVRSVSVPDVPTELAVSDDGSTLWFGLLNAPQAGQLRIGDFQLGSRVDLGNRAGQPNQKRYAHDIVVMAGTVDEIVVNTRSYSETVAYVNGVELPNLIDHGPTVLLVRDADTIVGANDSNTGFEAYTIRYNSQTGVVVEDVFEELSPGFNSPLQLGSVDIWNRQGYSFNDIEQARTGRLHSQIDTSSVIVHDYAVVSPADGVVYAIDGSDPFVEVFDEFRRTRLGVYAVDGRDLDIFPIDHAVITANEFVIAGDSHIARFAKSDLEPNIAPDTCRAISAGDLLIDGVYISLTCPLLDVVYDATRDQIYAALPGVAGPLGNAIVVIEPATLNIQSYIPLTVAPTSIAMNDDATVLTVTLFEANQIAEIDLSTLTVRRITNLGFDVGQFSSSGNPLIATSTRARPGFSDQIVVASGEKYLYMYDNGVQLPIGGRSRDWHTEIFFDENDSTRLIAHRGGEIDVMVLNGSGLDQIGNVQGVLVSRNIARQENRLMSSFGDELDIGTLTGDQVCDVDDHGSAFRGVTYSGRSNAAFFAETDSYNHEFVRCDLASGGIGETKFVTRFTESEINTRQRLFELNSGELIYLDDATLIKISAPD